MSYEKYIKDNQPESVNELSKVLNQKASLIERLKELEEQEDYYNKIIPLEKSIVSWQYNYTKKAREQYNPTALNEQIANANTMITDLRNKLKEVKKLFKK